MQEALPNHQMVQRLAKPSNGGKTYTQGLQNI